MLRSRSYLLRRTTSTRGLVRLDRCSPPVLVPSIPHQRVVTVSLRPFVTISVLDQRPSPAISSSFWVRTLASLASSKAAAQLQEWDHKIDNLLQGREGSVTDAQTVLEEALGQLQDAHDDWALSARTKVFDAWIDHQQSLLDSFDRTFSAARAGGEQQYAQSTERQELVQQICQAASHAHSLLEEMESFLGARNVWLDTGTSPDDDAEYHGNISDGSASPEDIIHPHNDELTRRCNAMLSAWARAVKAGWKVNANGSSATRAIPQRATFLLERMEASIEDSFTNRNSPVTVQPTLESYNHVLEAWTYSKEHLRAAAAERIFARMQSRQEGTAGAEVRPDGQSFRLMVWAWALSHQEERFAFNATGHLMKMLRKLERSFDSGNQVYDHALEPTMEDYHVVMKAWSLSEEKQSPGKALSILNLMENACKKGVTMIQPDETCYRYLLQTASHRPHLPRLGSLVDHVLIRMRTNYFVPDSKCFTAAIRTWKNAALHEPNVPSQIREASIRRAMELLTEMEVADQQSTSVSVEVSTENVNDVLEALTVSRNYKRMEQAEHLLSRMEQALTDGKTHLAPNAESYIQVLRVWSTHGSIEKVAKAKLILLRMQDHFAAISSLQQQKKTTLLVDVFNEYIRVCGSFKAPSDKEGMQVLREALSAIEMLKSLGSLRANSATYAALLDACGNLLSVGKERQVVVERIFTLCCKDGMVDGTVLQHMRAVASTDQYSVLVDAASETVDGMRVVPETWTANALGGRVASVGGRRISQLSVDGTPAQTASMSEYKMRRLRDKRNRNLLRGGRLKKPERKSPWRLHDPAQLYEQV